MGGVSKLIDHALTPPGSPELEVIIVTYGGPNMVRQCLTSLQMVADEVQGMVICVVDNASPDDTPKIVRDEFPGVRLYEQSYNSGFAVANNIALRRVTAPFILVLNPDTQLAKGTLAHLVAQMRVETGIGVLGCRLVTATGNFDHAAKRSIPTPLDAATYFLSRLFPSFSSKYEAPQVGEHEKGQVDAVNGAFMLIRKTALDQVGMLDERYWMYGEDMDWCVRFRQRGWQVAYDGRVTVLHLKGGSSGRRRHPQLNWHFHKSMFIFYRTHLAGKSAIVDCVVYAAIAVRCVVTTIGERTISVIAPLTNVGRCLKGKLNAHRS